MKSPRFFALIFSFFITIFGAGATDIYAQEPEVPQIAKNSDEKRAASAGTENGSENPPVRNSLSAPAANPNLTRVGVQTDATLPLTLNETIRKALENNNDIEISKTDVRIAESNLRSLLGVYDGVFTFNPNFDRTATVGQEPTKDFRVNSDFTQRVKQGGGNFRVFFDNSRNGSRSSAQQNANLALSDSLSGLTYFSSIGATFTQPLFRNFKTDNERRQIKIQRKRISQSDADFRRQTIGIIAQVQTGYWDLVFALRNQQNQVANVNLSRENLRQIEAKIKAGAEPDLARAEVETELATREGELLSATQQVAEAENRLKQLVLRDPNATEWTKQFVPTDNPVYSEEPVSLDLAMQDALANRPELSRLKLEKEVNDIDVAFFKNQTKPQIDLTGTFSLEGLSLGRFSNGLTTNPVFVPEPIGQETTSDTYIFNLVCRSNNTTAPERCNQTVPTVTTGPLAPNYLRGGYFSALRNIFRNDARNFSVGVVISFPFRNQTAKADLATARIQTERIGAQTRAQEQVVISEVRNAVQAVETARARVLTARRARENAEKQLQGQRRLFDVGRATTFLLFERENALTNARNAEIRAETDFNKALADLQQATSTTFEANNIDVESPTNGPK